MNIWDQELYLKAWNYATVQHNEQTYGGPKEGLNLHYLTHIGMVSTEIMHTLHHTKQSYEGNLAIQCAILHDTIEDTSASAEEVTALFGNDVAAGVMALTKNESLPSKAEMMQDSLQRIKAQPHEIWMVKMADRISNLYHPPHYWNEKKIRKYADEAKMILDELQEANELLAERLNSKIDAYSNFF